MQIPFNFIFMTLHPSAPPPYQLYAFVFVISTPVLHLPITLFMLHVFIFLSFLPASFSTSPILLFSLPLSLLYLLYLSHRTLEILTRNAHPTQQKALVEAFLRNREDVNIHNTHFVCVSSSLPVLCSFFTYNVVLF